MSIRVTEFKTFFRRRNRGGRRLVSFASASVNVVWKHPSIVFMIWRCTVENLVCCCIMGDLISSGRCQMTAVQSIRGAVTEVKSLRRYRNDAPQVTLAMLAIASPN